MQLVSQGDPGPDPLFTAYSDDEHEAAGVATKVKAIIDSGTAASEVAVLFRTNGQSQLIEQALADAEVPYLVRGERFFNREEVRRALVLAARQCADRRRCKTVGGVGQRPPWRRRMDR